MRENRLELPDDAKIRATSSEATGPVLRVLVRQAGARQFIEPALEEAEKLDDFRARFLAAFGTADDVIAEALLGQLLNVLHTGEVREQREVFRISAGKTLPVRIIFTGSWRLSREVARASAPIPAVKIRSMPAKPIPRP